MQNKTNSDVQYYYGLPNASAQAFFVSKQLLERQKNVFFLTHNETDHFDNAILEFTAGKPVTLISLPDEKVGLMAALHQLLLAKNTFVISAEYTALLRPLPNPSEFKAHTFTIRRGDSIRRQDLVDILHNNGYSREDYTEYQGQYAVRGSVVDIFCLDQDKPLRLYFSGNRIDSISSFDIDTQNTKEHKDQAVIVPIQFSSEDYLITDYIKDATYVFENPAREFDVSAYHPALVISTLPTDEGFNCNLKANLSFSANMQLLDKEIQSLTERGIRTSFTCLNRGELDRLGELMQDYPHLRNVPMRISPLTQGFYSPEEKFGIITSSEILSRHYNASSIVKNFEIEGAQRVRFKELQPGDYIVHQSHGIGKYLGLEVMDKEENPTDCLIIEFRRGSKLYVPMYDFKKVQKYIGGGGKAPTLSALGGVAWRDIKKRVKEDAQKMAKEILQAEALRQATEAPAFPGDSHMEQEFADSFPFVQTPGQSQAIEDVLRDLHKSRPMDRVLVGDVGFGKTEVAMRAALRVALAGKQVMVVVPTTILAAQHYKTFSKRMAGFPVNIQMISRFQTKKEQRETIHQIKDGVCEIIIGTHRLLSKDVVFKDLGLCIIDEEHRFGVKQKEKIKAKSVGVHTLMLSATPIPRTLNQSLSSLRDISLIDTPPRGRTPIKTVVTAWNNDLAANAIRQELARGGQIYYVYNSVQSMESRFLFLKNLVPEARICMAHGQMKETDLEQTLWDFNNQKFDILLASTIIESGIDITNANTLIIENAQNFGLAQLYQLRGRIGRGDKKAYCYLFHPDWLFKKQPPKEVENTYAQLLATPQKTRFQEKDPTEEAKKRLSALMEFSDLGSGFKLALRDMEIRGAGELLGVKQHGYVNEVGLSLYCDLIANEVKKLKGEKVVRQIRATVNLPLSAYIPPDYLPDDSERLKYYKEMMNADELRTRQILERLADLAGPVPQELRNLARVLQISRRAGLIKIYHVEFAYNMLDLLFTSDFKMPPELPAKVLERYGGRTHFIKSKNGDGIRLSVQKGADPVAEAEQAVTFFESLIKA